MLFYYHNCNSKLETTRKTKKSYNSQLFQKWIASHLKHYYTHFLKLFRTDLFVQQIASKNRISMLILLHFLHMIRHQFWIERHFFNQLVFAREKNNQIMYLLQGIRVSKLYRFASCEHSRVRNKHRPILIHFWPFFCLPTACRLPADCLTIT